MVQKEAEENEIQLIYNMVQNVYSVTENFHSETATMAGLDATLDGILDQNVEVKERVNDDADIVFYLEFEGAVA